MYTGDINFGRRNPGASKLDILQLLDKITALEARVEKLESEQPDEPAKRGRKPKEASE